MAYNGIKGKEVVGSISILYLDNHIQESITKIDVKKFSFQDRVINFILIYEIYYQKKFHVLQTFADVKKNYDRIVSVDGGDYELDSTLQKYN